MSGTAWPKEHLTYLADLVDKGRTASKAAHEINRRFGTDYSASAMIGMAKRRGLHWKHKGGFDWHRKQAPAPFAQPLDLVAIMRKPKVAITSALDPDEIPVEQRKQLVDLGNHDCRFPYGEVGTPTFFFCGGAGADVTAGVAYCPSHLAIACNKPRPFMPTRPSW